MPEFRGHHLICLHFFHGEGYGRTFNENLMSALRRAEMEGVTVTAGIDAVCSACPYLKENRCAYKDNADKEISEMDAKALSLLALSPGDHVGWNGLRQALSSHIIEWSSLYCCTCNWRDACKRDALYQELVAGIFDR